MCEAVVADELNVLNEATVLIGGRKVLWKRLKGGEAAGGRWVGGVKNAKTTLL